MNTALLLSNAVALAIVLGFHFAPENGAEPVAQHMPHYLQLQKAPQWAVQGSQHEVIGQPVTQDSYSQPAPSSERLVF
ncbi:MULTISPECIES: hypothetical protein [Pseudomonas]|jgi:hypothetical protein|uniref:hypothetical protein n=1 Tax=Pseudomonas TaxID=286 RepID=UPI0017877532|nr:MULTISPECIES: hypothetical protein [Pseudomonas]MBD9441022.1 hypothetical protein [Pseudomonas sp. PDM04]